MFDCPLNVPHIIEFYLISPAPAILPYFCCMFHLPRLLRLRHSAHFREFVFIHAGLSSAGGWPHIKMFGDSQPDPLTITQSLAVSAHGSKGNPSKRRARPRIRPSTSSGHPQSQAIHSSDTRSISGLFRSGSSVVPNPPLQSTSLLSHTNNLQVCYHFLDDCMLNFPICRLRGQCT